MNCQRSYAKNEGKKKEKKPELFFPLTLPSFLVKKKVHSITIRFSEFDHPENQYKTISSHPLN